MAECADGIRGSMRTTTRVHSPEERHAMRLRGGLLAWRSQWRLVAGAVILRTAVTRVLPLAGAAGWWMTLVCLVPGLALYALGCLALKWTKRESLGGGSALPLLVALGLTVEAASAITALITLFTEGVGTRGTQWTLAISAAGLLLFALNREGLARGVYFLRMPLAALLAVALGSLAAMGKADGFFPLLGDGVSSLFIALKAGVGMGWVFVLPLMEKSPARWRMAEPLPVVLVCVAAMACLNFALPHEIITRQLSLGDSLVMTVAHLPAFSRLMTICLWMAALFLALGSMVSLAEKYALMPWKREVVWLPGVLALAVSATQLMDVRQLWLWLGAAEPWLLMIPVAALFGAWRKKR